MNVTKVNIPVPTPPPEFDIRLSEDEARKLRRLLHDALMDGRSALGVDTFFISTLHNKLFQAGVLL